MLTLDKPRRGLCNVVGDEAAVLYSARSRSTSASL